ncbi:hypothetical protein HU200_001709 [Digitaria exilis]|uniref:Uncharacterized protein n=1 Tax=Digitaria exilis TaxID=1010633 RepID=A0A835KZP1_9POAL|nr:hypothetical protein HU200_001709 [Digitaria exilis]
MTKLWLKKRLRRVKDEKQSMSAWRAWGAKEIDTGGDDRVARGQEHRIASGRRMTCMDDKFSGSSPRPDKEDDHGQGAGAGGICGGEMLALLKQDMGFVIDSVVALSLLRMSDAGKGQARSAVESLVASGGTSTTITEGLRMAAKVRNERRHKKAVSSSTVVEEAPQLSRGPFAMESSDQSNPCAICLGNMGAGGGQAIFTAECSHTFHFHCISASVAHGHRVCPLCNSQWRELPFERPPQPLPPPPQQPVVPPHEPIHHVQPSPIRHRPMHHHVQPPFQPAEPEVFDDDDQVVEPPPSGQDAGQRQSAASGGSLAVKTHTEYSAVARGSSLDNFAVLVHVKAPGMIDAGDAPRAPLDLVTVLDVSGSMSGEKLALLKQAMGFVIDNLGPHDRLSVVAFSSGAHRVTRLLRMSDAGKGQARTAVESLVARGGTNIAEGLRTAAKVLDERRHRNAVSSVILLSDGQDNYTMMRQGQGSIPNYESLVPASFTRTGTGTGDWSSPIHTFGFGNDHDAAAMHVVAEATGGTFSYIENEAVIQDAFAQCIGGLLTVVVQEARIAVACGDPGVRVISVKSGRYQSRVDEEDGRRSATIAVGELYADEERRFLLFLSVPPATDGEEAGTTLLIKVSCSYRDAAGGGVNVTTAEDTVVARPEQVGGAAAERSMEVERERVRVEAAEDIAAARAAAERGAHQEAVEILENRQRVVEESGAARAGDPTTAALGAELREMRRRVGSRESYARSGRAFVLAGMSMHAQQRASMMPVAFSSVARRGIGRAPANSIAGARRVSSDVLEAAEGAAEEASSFATPAMRAMLLRSRRAREGSAEDPKGGEGTGSSGATEVVNQ